MPAAALLALLAALPGRAGETVTPAQARASVVGALPPDIARGAGQGDLRTYLERLTPEQKQAALRSLTAKEGELGDDPATLGVIGQAYAGLGKVKEARQVAEAALRRTPDDPAARQLLGWVASQEKLQGRGPSAEPAGGRFAPAAPPAAGLSPTERQVQGLFQRGSKSAEFRDTLQDAEGFSVAELRAAGITFSRADAGQRDAVMVTKTADGINVAIRGDALGSRGDAEARGAAHVANGVRQAQTKRDHPLIGAAIIWARGWWTGATVHKELAPADTEARPAAPADQELMLARKLLDQKTNQFDPEKESYGTTGNQFLPMMNNFSKIMPADKLFERFATSVGGNRS